MPHVVFRMLKRHFFRRVLLMSLPCLALAGCVPNAVNHVTGDPSQEKIPPYQLADYLATECTDIWSLTSQPTETNPLYWLRAMDCANRLMPVQARSEASMMMPDTWQGAFRRGILLDKQLLRHLKGGGCYAPRGIKSANSGRKSAVSGLAQQPNATTAACRRAYALQ